MFHKKNPPERPSSAEQLPAAAVRSFPDDFTPQALYDEIAALRRETAQASTDAFAERLYSLLAHPDLSVTVDIDAPESERRLAAGEPAFLPGTEVQGTLIVMVFGYREARRQRLLGTPPRTGVLMDRDAARDFYAGHFAMLAEHWTRQTTLFHSDRCAGITFSFLQMLDGAGTLPALNVTHRVTGARLPHTLESTWFG